MNHSQLATIDRRICGDVWTSSHAARLRDGLCHDIGPRPTGSKAFRAAQAVVAAALRKAGATKVRTEPVPVLAWTERGATLALRKPHRKEYDACQHVHTKPGNITGPLVRVPGTDDATLDRLGRRLEGAVVLVSGPGITIGNYRPLTLGARELVARGAAGLIMSNAFVGMGPAQRHLGVTDALAIPAVGVSHDAGRELESLADTGRSEVRLTAAGRSRRATCSNLVAELAPPRSNTEAIILNAHLDSLPITPGALDNLSGVLTLIEIVRALAPHQARFRRSLRLLIPTGEEYGLVGSAQYVRDHQDTLDEIRFDFSLDTLTPETARGVAVMWAPAMRNLIDRSLRAAGRGGDVRDHYCQGSDYLPFMLQGIPAARAADWEGRLPPWCHTPMDDAHNLPAHWIQLNAMTYAQLLLRLLAQDRPLPAARHSEEDIAALVAHEGMGDYMRFLGLMG